MTLPAEGAVLLVGKPEGPTSHDVVARVRRGLRTRRVGHTGTLDPFASGLLLLVVGPATRLSPFLTGLDKTYEAVARLGVTTDSFDRDGALVSERGCEGVGREEIEAALATLRGDIVQRPPALSAKKVGGEAAHRRVRRGEEVSLEAVPVTVHELRLDAYDPPWLRFTARCSSGTYVRALAHDLGEAVGCGAHLTELRRTAVGPFAVERAATLEALDRGELPPRALWTPAEALEAAGMPSVSVDRETVARVIQGQPIVGPADLPEETGRVAVVDERGLVAVADHVGGRLRPRKVFRAAAGSA